MAPVAGFIVGSGERQEPLEPVMLKVDGPLPPTVVGKVSLLLAVMTTAGPPTTALPVSATADGPILTLSVAVAQAVGSVALHTRYWQMPMPVKPLVGAKITCLGVLPSNAQAPLVGTPVSVMLAELQLLFAPVPGQLSLASTGVMTVVLNGVLLLSLANSGGAPGDTVSVPVPVLFATLLSLLASVLSVTVALLGLVGVPLMVHTMVLDTATVCPMLGLPPAGRQLALSPAGNPEMPQLALAAMLGPPLLQLNAVLV